MCVTLWLLSSYAAHLSLNYILGEGRQEYEEKLPNAVIWRLDSRSRILSRILEWVVIICAPLLVILLVVTFITQVSYEFTQKKVKGWS